MKKNAKKCAKICVYEKKAVILHRGIMRAYYMEETENGTSSSGNYYGICQWSKGYSEVHGTDLYYQCEFLKKTIQYEFDTYGSKYQSGFNYESFINLTNEREAALAFAKCYERCNSNYYAIREDNATIAYNYFTN